MNQTNTQLYKNIFVTIILIIFIILIIGVLSYMLNIEKKYSESFNQTKQKVMDDTEMTTITNMYSFQESEFYHIFLGENESKDNLISVVQFDKENANPIDEIKTYDRTDFISQKSILDKWAETCDRCEFINIQPAIIDDTLLWEISYNDVEEHYVLAYYLMTDGQEFESLKFQRNFK